MAGRQDTPVLVAPNVLETELITVARFADNRAVTSTPAFRYHPRSGRHRLCRGERRCLRDLR
jgi:hypothetical protein